MEDPLKFLAKFVVVKEGDQTIFVGDQTVKEVPLQPTRPAWLNQWMPRPSDIEFFRILLRTLRDRAIWRVPATGSEYVWRLPERQLALIKGELDEWFWKNLKCMSMLEPPVFVVVDKPKVQQDGAGKSAATQPYENNPDHTLL